jgi:multiple sugar transport system permease protein
MLDSKVEITKIKRSFLDGRFGEVTEGFNAEKDVVVNVVSNRKRKRDYTIGGVLNQEQTNNRKAWLYLAPVLILMSIFLIYPLINTIFIAFMKNYNYIDGSFEGFTFDNFLIIMGQKEVSEGTGVLETNFVQYAIPNTFIIVFLTVPISIIIALLISVLLNSIKWLQKFFQVVFFLPYVTNTIAVGMVFSVLFETNGVINYIFNSNIIWVYGANRWVAMVPLCLYIIWGSMPFKILILLSGLQNVDKQYYQAAKIDASPQRKTLLKITVPALWPQILYLMVTSFIGAFKEYTAIVGLFNGPGTSGTGSFEMYTIVYYIYDNLNNKTQYAAAAAVFLFLIILFFTFLQLYLSKRRQAQ